MNSTITASKQITFKNSIVNINLQISDPLQLAGPKFSMPVTHKDLPINNVITNIECIANSRDIDSYKNDVRLLSVNIISNFLFKNKNLVKQKFTYSNYHSK